MSSETTTKTMEPHPFLHFKEAMDSIFKEDTKGVLPLTLDAEPRISDLSNLKVMQEQIEKKEKYKDRLARPLLSLGEGWGLLFPQ